MNRDKTTSEATQLPSAQVGQPEPKPLMCRLSKRRRYERNRNGEGSRPGRYGFTVRHVRCDRCQRDYLPQHVNRVARWRWECGNCTLESGCCVVVERRPLLRWRYQNDPRTLEALGLPPLLVHGGSAASQKVL